MAETIPGGYYLGPDGKTPHDANGKPIEKRSDVELKRARQPSLLSAAEREVEAMQFAAEQRAAVAQAQADAAAAEAKVLQVAAPKRARAPKQVKAAKRTAKARLQVAAPKRARAPKQVKAAKRTAKASAK
jgi:hypothetical protein